MIEFVRQHATALLGEAPRLFAVSARDAQAARADGSVERWAASGFDAMDTYLVRTLDQEERIRLKLLNPLNVGLRLAARYKDVAFERLKLLAQDIETIQNIDRQLALFHDEMVRDVEPRLARLDVLLGDMERRGFRFFEETLRIGRIRTLMDSEGVRRAFEREVIGDTPAQLETETGRVIDWIVERNLKAWQDVSGYIDRRQIDRHREGMVGDVGGSFTYNRQALLESIGRVAREVVGQLRPRGGGAGHRQRRPGHLRHDRAGAGGRARPGHARGHRADRRGGRRDRPPARDRAGGERLLRHPAQAPPGPARFRRRIAELGPGFATGSPARCTSRSPSRPTGSTRPSRPTGGSSRARSRS